MNRVKQLIEKMCQNNRKKTAFVFLKKDATVEIDFQTFYQDILLASKHLLKMAEKELHIGVACDNSYAYIVVVFAILFCGKKAVLMENTLPTEGILRKMAQTDCKVFLHNGDGDACIEGLMVKSFDAFFDPLDQTGYLEQVSYLEQTTDAGLILFTSGTEGDEKAVVMSQDNIQFVVECMLNGIKTVQYQKKVQRLSILLPLYHMYGLSTLIGFLYVGYPICLHTDLKRVLKEIKELKPDVIECVPAFIEYLFHKCSRNGSGDHEDIRQLLGDQVKVMICGGAFLEQKYQDALYENGILYVTGYGLTETSMIVTILLYDPKKTGSVGKILPHFEAKITDGEIWLRGSGIMQGYYNDQDATRKAFCDGWFLTGDLGYLDEEGYLFLTGRKKNLIILSNGENVSSEKIEKSLCEMDLIEEALVYEKDHKIYAEIYSCKTDLKELIQEAVDTYNRSVKREYQIDTFILRNRPFERNKLMKIKRTKKGS